MLDSGAWFLITASWYGDVAEWLKAHAWKVCIGATLSRVRISPSPPICFHNRSHNILCGFFFTNVLGLFSKNLSTTVSLAVPKIWLYLLSSRPYSQKLSTFALVIDRLNVLRLNDFFKPSCYAYCLALLSAHRATWKTFGAERGCSGGSEINSRRILLVHDQRCTTQTPWQ